MKRFAVFLAGAALTATGVLLAFPLIFLAGILTVFFVLATTP
jgi:hypothetical protein